MATNIFCMWKEELFAQMHADRPSGTVGRWYAKRICIQVPDPLATIVPPHAPRLAGAAPAIARGFRRRATLNL